MRPRYSHNDEELRAEKLEVDDFQIRMTSLDAPFESYSQYGVEMNGLMNKEGILHRCRYEGHEHLSRKLGFSSSEGPEAAGYVKLQEGEFFMRDYEDNYQKQCTQAQLNRMLKWAEEHKAPSHLVDEILKFWEVAE